LLTKKSMLVAGALTTLGAASVLGIHSVSAATTGSTDQSIVDKIATKFSLDKNEVKQVFEEDRQAHEAERQAKAEKRLDKAVQDGKLTEEQKTKILNKLEEMKSQIESDHESFKDLTPDERHEQMEKKRTELEAWAKDNGIPMEFLMLSHSFKGPGGGHGEVHMRFDGGSEHSLDVRTE
jgi:hypothetical protein